MDEIIKLLMNMGKTKEEALEFVGKEMPAGGIDDVGSNIIKPITKKVAGDYPLIGSRITDPTQQGQFGKYFIQTLDPKDRYNLIRQSIDDQKENWQKTFEFIRTGGYKLSDLQKQNLNYNLGVLQRSKIVLTDITKGLESQKIDVEELYSSFVKNKRFLGNESTGLSSEGNDILEYINKTKEKIEDLTKTGKKQEEILSQQKKDNDARMKRLYNGRAYEKNDGNYRALGGYHLPKLHEAGIINLDPKIYEAIKKGEYHHGGAVFFAPDPNRVLQYHFGTKIFDDLDDAINKAAMDGEVALKGPDGMIKFLKDNDYLPFKKDGPANALDYLNDVEKLERVKELDSATKTIKSGQSSFYKTPDQIMGKVMENANDKFQYLDSLKRTHPGKFKLYQKDISEEPFFGVDIGQNDLFSDLSDLSFPKDKGDLLQFPKKEKEGIKAIVADSEEGKKITESLLNKLDQVSGENVVKLADPVAEAVAAIKALKPMDAMKEANKVAGKQDNYANLSDEQINKILEDTNDHIFERDLPTDDFDMAEGGRINFRSAGFISGRTKSSKSKSSSSKGPAGGASAGGNYGGNVNPNQTYAGKTQSQTPSNYGGTGPSTKTKTKPKNKTVTKPKTKPKTKTNTNTATYGIDKTVLASLINQTKINKGLFSGNVKMTYHGSPFSKNILNEGFKTGNKFSVAPGKVFSTTNPKFASTYGKPISLLSSKSAFSAPSINLNTGAFGKEVIQNPNTATKGMNIAKNIGTKFTGPTAKRLATGATLGKNVLSGGNLPLRVGLTAFDVALQNPAVKKYGTLLGEKVYDLVNKSDGGIISLRKRR